MLRITKFTDYGVQLLVLMANQKGPSQHSAKALSERSNLPRPTVSKTLKLLTRSGLLKSNQGSTGGYTLAKPAAEITIAEMMQTFEGPLALTDCCSKNGCSRNCMLHTTWQRVNHVIENVLNNITLADIATGGISTRMGAESIHRKTQCETNMKLAIPTANGKLSMHFGHCETFTMLDIDPENKTITATTEMDPPPHEPGVLPHWLAQQSADMIIAGGMGQQAQTLFEDQNIKVVIGAPSESPEALAKAYLAGTLEAGSNACKQYE